MKLRELMQRLEEISGADDYDVRIRLDCGDEHVLAGDVGFTETDRDDSMREVLIVLSAGSTLNFLKEDGR